MRHAIACKQCRETKRKCVRTGREEACANCRERRQDCSFIPHYSQGPAKGTAPLVSYTGPRKAGILSQLTWTQLTDLVRDYFTLIHDRPHSLFHRPTFLEDLESDRVEAHLLAGLCSLAAYLSHDDSIRRLGLRLASEARALLLTNIEKPTISRIQTAILLANVYAAELDPQAEAMFFSIGNRMAQILRLHDVDHRDDPVTQQVKNRIWWSLIMADHWSSTGLMIQRQLAHHGYDLPLPGPEDILQRARPYQENLDTTSLGLWAHMINLVRIFGLSQDMNRMLALERLSHSDLNHQVDALAQQLDAWAASLPNDTVLNDENIQRYIDRGLGGAFVALHLGFHHYLTLLFFHTLDFWKPHEPKKDVYARRCRGHALTYSKLLHSSRSTRGCETIFATVGHMTVVSSSVLLHTLLFGDEDDLIEAKRGLVVNFEALIELEKYWPSVKTAIKRLLTFQEACQQPVNLNTHKIDQWMFRFLYEHSNSIDDHPMSGRFMAPSPVATTDDKPAYQRVAEGREAALISALDTLRR